MKIRDSLGWKAIILFVVGVITFIMRIGQTIEIEYPGNVTTGWILVGTWGVAFILYLIICIFDKGYKHGKRHVEQQVLEREKSFMERKT